MNRWMKSVTFGVAVMVSAIGEAGLFDSIKQAANDAANAVGDAVKEVGATDVVQVKTNTEARAGSKTVACNKINEYLNGEFKERYLKLGKELNPKILEEVNRYAQKYGCRSLDFVEENAKYGFFDERGGLMAAGLASNRCQLFEQTWIEYADRWLKNAEDVFEREQAHKEKEIARRREEQEQMKKREEEIARQRREEEEAAKLAARPQCVREIMVYKEKGDCEEYARRLGELHNGERMTAFKDIALGDSPFSVYSKLKDQIIGNPSSDDRTDYGVPRQKAYQFGLENHQLTAVFSRYDNSDVPVLVGIGITFLKAKPTIVDLKVKYEKMGFACEVSKAPVGMVWKDPGHTPSHVGQMYSNAKFGVAMAKRTKANRELNQFEQDQYDRDLKIMADIEKKHMMQIYEESVTGKSNGYFLIISAESPKVKDGLIQNSNVNPDLAVNVVIMDAATIDSINAEQEKQVQARKDREAKEAAEKAQKESAAALDF